MHQLAIYLHQQGNTVTGSDDVIFDPALGQLAAYGILPPAFGWHTERIKPDLDIVILGMHAKPGNPELEKALELQLPVCSFPEFIYERSRHKKRLVVAGSHGKTSITSMIMHILRHRGVDFDYLVGSRIEGFDTMVRISDSAPYIVIEGDEYLSSAIDPRSKFLHYHPHVAVISGIAWDHINVFPEFDRYLDTFREFISTMEAGGTLFYYGGDEYLPGLATDAPCIATPYRAYDWTEADGQTFILHDDRSYPVHVFGRHNMENIRAAVMMCAAIGIPEEEALAALADFRGSAKRLEEIFRDDERRIYVYRDFAHAPSKLQASIEALRQKYPDKHICALFELHTYSSLQPEFLDHYTHSMDPADSKAVCLDAHALQIKGRQDIPDDRITGAFCDNTIEILRNAGQIEAFVRRAPDRDVIFAFMSSGNFAGFDPLSVFSK
jgi:UDP-N-acetylmuramate: L-alanyl-gamma-D-glutamyl-meso-diaminopimelate ligase